MKRVLDLRFHGRLPAELCADFEAVAYRCREPFNELVATISRPHLGNIDWWVQSPASRNTFASPLFHNICCMHFVRQRLERRRFDFDAVVVDSPALRALIERILRDGGNAACCVRVAGGLRRFLGRAKNRYLAVPASVLRRLAQHCIARSTASGGAAPRRPRTIVLIDTFITADYAAIDRWYGSFWDSLTDELKAETYFAPTLVATPLSRMRSTFLRMRAGPRKALVKDDYLTAVDILRAAGCRRRAAKLRIPALRVAGYEVTELVREELLGNPDVPTVVESLLTDDFVRRLKESGQHVRLAIDWFEGQAIDKAWNLAMRRHYPGTKRIGYRAFESFPFYLCSYPIPIEREAGVIPDVMAVQGRGTISTVREFLPDLDVIVIPSFKSQHVWQDDEGSARDPGAFTVLVTLPISIHSSVRMLERVLDLESATVRGRRTVRYVVKPHPAVGAEPVVSRIQRSVPAVVTFTGEASFAKLLRQADLLITEASSTCLEALAAGVPVVIMQNEEGLTNDPVPAAIPCSLVGKARSSRELVEAIEYFGNLPQHVIERQREDGRRIREDYFEPVTRAGVERFMDIGGQEAGHRLARRETQEFAST